MGLLASRLRDVCLKEAVVLVSDPTLDVLRMSQGSEVRPVGQDEKDTQLSDDFPSVAQKCSGGRNSSV